MALHSLYCADVPLRNCSLTQQHRVLPLPVDISIRVYAGCLDVDMTSVIFTYFVIFST